MCYPSGFQGCRAEANRTIRRFLDSFLEDAYGPLMSEMVKHLENGLPASDKEKQERSQYMVVSAFCVKYTLLRQVIQLIEQHNQ